jgi:hypothetical protein
MSTARTLPTVIGVTENALRALLTQILSNTRIESYAAWVILNSLSKADSSGNWKLATADILKMEVSEINTLLAQLRLAGLIGNDDALSDAGATELAKGRFAVSAITSRLVEGISQEEQDTTLRVLDRIRSMASDLVML